jgi:hypothetical protein
LSSSPETVIWLAMLGVPLGPEPTFGAPDPPTVTCGEGFDATVRGADDGRLRASRFGNGCGFAETVGACTVTGGSVSALVCDCA